MNRTYKRSVVAKLQAGSIAAAVLALTPTMTLAKSKATAIPTDTGLEEVVVTAQYRRQNLQDTPIAITAVNASMMEARSQTNLTDIAAIAPNVTIRQSNTSYGNTAAVYIRGIGQFDNSFAYEPGVGIYVDDVYYPTVIGAQLDLLDLDRVEILRGPQGTLDGMNSIGGAVKLYSKRPEGTGEGFVEATLGQYDRLNFRGSVDVPIIKDVLAVRLAGVSESGGGYVDRMDYGCLYPASGFPKQGREGCKLGEMGGQDFKGLRAYASYTPNDRFRFDLIGEWTQDDSEPAATRITAVNNGALAPRIAGVDLTPFLTNSGKYENFSTYTDSYNGITVPPNNQDHGWGVSGQLHYDVTDALSLTSITAYRTYDAKYGLDIDGSPYGFGTQVWDLTYSSFTQELRLNGKALNDILNYTVGGFYFSGKGHYYGLIDFYQPANNTYNGNDKIPSTSKSAFAHLEVTPLTNLTLSGGIRYTDSGKDFTYGRVSLLTLPFTLGTLNGKTFSYSSSRLDYRASVEYRWSPEIMTYADVSTGFKGGGVNPRPFYVQQVVTFKPETVTAYEIGTKMNLFDNRVRLDLAGFMSKYSAIQLVLNQSYLGTSPASVPINAGTADISGFEAELSAEPIDGLLLDSSFSYLDFKYNYLSPNAQASGIHYGMTSPYTPKLKADIGVQYEINAGNVGSFVPRADYEYQSEFWSNAVNRVTDRTPGYSLVNTRLTWILPDDRVEVALAVLNVFNKYYYLSNYDVVLGITGVAQGAVAPPREWQVTVKYNF